MPAAEKFDLKSDASRRELVQKLVGKFATIKRSSGEEESDWYVIGVREDGFVVAKDKAGLQKRIKTREFLEMNPGLFDGMVIDG